MSGSEMDVTCACGHAFRAWIWQSANAARSPDLRQAILAGNMNVVACPACGARFHVEVRFLYHDMSRQEWIWVYPVSYADSAEAVSAEVEKMWEQVGDTMPSHLRRALEGNYKTIVLFGMDALVKYLRSQAEARKADAKPATKPGTAAGGPRSAP